MSRLFVALTLPKTVKERLIALQPAKGKNIRLVDVEQMHITLHFIGDANSEEISAVLEAISLPEFTLAINSVGKFSSRGSTTLWAGLEENKHLENLHCEVGTALERIGFKQEARTFRPHVTLARCKKSYSRDCVQQFLDEHTQFCISDIPAEQFTLYRSDFIDGSARYCVERVFSLSD